MANNLRVFNTNSEYQSADLVHPAVSYVIETDKVHYEPTTPSFQGKWKATYSDSSVTSAECGSSSEIVRNEINKTKLVSVEIGDCVTSIGLKALDHSIGLTSCTIGNSVTNIGEKAFGSCSSLTSIVIPDSVTVINTNAFSICTSLTNCTIGSGVTSIGRYALDHCTSLTGITVNAITPPTLGGGTFDYTNNCPIYVPCESVEAYKSAYKWSNYASRITCIQPSFEGKWKATYSNGKVTSAECDSSSAITQNEINRTNLVSAEIGDCVTSIGAGVFSFCIGLTSIIIPNSVTSIDTYVFRDCSSLTSVTIGSGITSIGVSAFSNCSSLTSITVNAITPPTLGGMVFYDTNNCPIYVPAESVDAYKSAWSIYASRIQPIP